MDLYKEILLHLLGYQEAKIEVTFPKLKFSANEIVESAAYCALAQIQRILKDDTLSDEDCLKKSKQSFSNLNGLVLAAETGMILDKEKPAPKSGLLFYSSAIALAAAMAFSWAAGGQSS